MSDETTVNPPAPVGRSRRRRNVVGSSSHRDEYVRLMRAGWSSLAIERYAAWRYGEDVPASTIRTYKKKHGIESTAAPWGSTDPEKTIDVLQSRTELIQLQQERIAIDVKHERGMGKLLNGTRGEIEMLDRLLTSHKADLQDVGMMPKAGEDVTIHTSGEPRPDQIPKHMSLAEALGATPESEAEIAKVVHMATRRAVGDGVSGNGTKPSPT